MWLLHKYIPLTNIITPPFNNIGFVFIGTGFFIDLWSLILFFKHKTTFHPLKLEKTEKLVTSGMYKFSRNPMYLGLLLLLAGWAIMLGSLSAFVPVPLFVLLLNRVQIYHEEKILLEKFPDKYKEYRARVRRWF